MKITVQNDAIRKNIELFRDIVKKEEAGRLKNLAAHVNRHSGMLSFGTSVNEHDWKPITIRMNSRKKAGPFEALEVTSSDLEPVAYCVMAETINALNKVASIEALYDLEVESTRRVLDGKDLVHEAWHTVDRVGAEKLLGGRTEGTYIFRKDEYAQLLERELKESIKVLTLTVVEADDKICDYTVVCKDKRWLFYNDDPSLSGPSYPSIYDLLESRGELCQRPLLAT